MPYMGRISQTFMVVPLLNALVLANSLCQDSEDAALITVYNKSMNLRQTNLATSWQSPRDLAIVPPPTEVRAGAEVFTIYSAVPSFGEDGNFIALLLREPIKGRSIFCSGSGRAHLSQVRIFEHAMLCDWPEEEKKHELFEVFLEDAHGKHLAKVIANRKFGLLKKYQTVACVRDIFAPNRPNSLQAGQKAFGPALKMLVQWMEYNWLHGIDHFFIYTFNGTESAIKDVMEPYLKSGVATRIHFDHFQDDKVIRQKQVANDCLYRAKSHAKWALPSLDIDEYFRITSKQVFPGGGTVPQKYMRICWDALVKHYGKKPEEVPAFVFWKFRFARRTDDSLHILSSWREPHLQFVNPRCRGGHSSPEISGQKIAMQVPYVFDAHYHHIVVPKQSTALALNESIGVMNHYRDSFDHKHGEDDRNANVFDDAMLTEAPMLEKALSARFGQPLHDLWDRLR